MNRPGPQPVFRFAPSPNGFLHLGHAYSALLNFDLARVHGGRFLLRIEDIDTTRCRTHFEQAIYEDLSWLGLSWAEPALRQSEHFPRYGKTLDRLLGDGLLYPCNCSRQDIATAVARRERVTGAGWPRDPDGAAIYPGTCRHLDAQAITSGAKPFALRLRSALAQNDAACGWWDHALPDFRPDCFHRAGDFAWGDVVLARKEAPASYHLCVVLDDALQGVTHVVRGQDLQAATAIHRRLQDLLGLPAPLYAHHRLIRDPQGGKLSKSLASKSLRDVRREGASPADIRELLGLAPMQA